MTVKVKKKSKYGVVFIFMLTTLILLLNGQDVSAAIKDGMQLCANVIIPSVFPFLILSDYAVKAGVFRCHGKFTAFMCRVLGISPMLIPALILGNICGAPIGASMCCSKYNSRDVTASECEHTLAIATNPSPAFLITGVGMGMLGSFKMGMILFLTILTSTLITALIFRKKHEKTSFTPENNEQKFILSDSIKQGGFTSLGICSTISLFSAVIYLVELLFRNATSTAIISSFLEMSNAALKITSMEVSSFSFALLGFSLAFSGISVLIQVFSFSTSGISCKRYLAMKLSEGVIAFVIAYTAYLLLL